MQVNGYDDVDDVDGDRTNRFLSSHGTEAPNTLRERAASQPPRTSTAGQGFLSSPLQSTIAPPNGGSGAGPGPGPNAVWPRLGGYKPNSSMYGSLPQSVPTRSVSFSSSPPAAVQGMFAALRESRFASTFEDDESEEVSDYQDTFDAYDDRYPSPSTPMSRGRTYAADLTRSRSQSLAATRQAAIGSGLVGAGGLSPSSLWSDSLTQGQNVPGSRFGDLKLPGGNRYGSLAPLGRSQSNGYSGSIADHSNMSPFMRDVGQILLDDGSAFRELWGGMNPPRDENGGGGSGTTSRRHSVSAIQQRRPIVGFNAPSADSGEEPGMYRGAFAGRRDGGGLMLTDDDLASDLNMLSLNMREPPPRSSSNIPPPSQPSSLPTYVPLARSPSTSDHVSPYQALQLNIPGGFSASRQAVGSPSDGGFSAGSPSRVHEAFTHANPYPRESSRQGTQGLTARFVPGQGIQHIPEQNLVFGSPISPSGVRPGGHYAQQVQAQSLQRRPSDGARNLNDLGKGVPLHSVPTSWPLYIVEFKAGRTDLFYCTDLSQDIRVGDLVIVEADRGKDLGKVINDTITLAEVEAFQKQQKLINIGYNEAHGVPTSPNGTGPSSGKDINPKMIYGKASQQDLQGLSSKLQDEARALELCKTKVRQKKLPMEVVDAEYQWDRRKLTFYFVAEKRIDFRELVRELFRLYKTRIWMASLSGTNYEQ